jgi:hypothetical protein
MDPREDAQVDVELHTVFKYKPWVRRAARS